MVDVIWRGKWVEHSLYGILLVMVYASMHPSTMEH